MAAYYVLAGISVAWAVLLTAAGLTRRDFPPTGGMARGMMGFAVALAAVTVVTLVATTHVEHPREEAAEAAEQKEAPEEPQGAGQAPAEAPPKAAAKTVPVSENEFSIKIEGGTDLKAGSYRLAVANEGKIDHDLAVEDGGPEQKTPLLGPGKKGDLQVDLKPGKYRFYCTVPGHAQSGMEEEVTVE